MKCVLIPPGEFLMGSSPEELAKGSEPKWFRSEQPQHQVRITRPFYLGVYEVTQEQYQVREIIQVRRQRIACQRVCFMTDIPHKGTPLLFFLACSSSR